MLWTHLGTNKYWLKPKATSVCRNIRNRRRGAKKNTNFSTLIVSRKRNFQLETPADIDWAEFLLLVRALRLICPLTLRCYCSAGWERWFLILRHFSGRCARCAALSTVCVKCKTAPSNFMRVSLALSVDILFIRRRIVKLPSAEEIYRLNWYCGNNQSEIKRGNEIERWLTSVQESRWSMPDYFMLVAFLSSLLMDKD